MSKTYLKSDHFNGGGSRPRPPPLSLLQEIGQERVIILGEFEVYPLFLNKAQALHHLKGRHVQQGVLAATGLLGLGM